MQTPTSPPPKQKSEKAKSSSPVADSWEDEADSLSEEDSKEKNNNAASSGNNSNRNKITINNKYNNYSDNDSTPISPIAARDGIREPPPTPSSPQQFSAPWVGLNAAPYSSYGGSNTNMNTIRPSPAGRIAADRRPEKQTAVAGRLIAGALGIRAPKRTEEQRAYDRAVKEQEIKRRNEEMEKAAKAREEEERAKAAIWDD